jgi:hypothetical protein
LCALCAEFGCTLGSHPWEKETVRSPNKLAVFKRVQQVFSWRQRTGLMSGCFQLAFSVPAAHVLISDDDMRQFTDNGIHCNWPDYIFVLSHLPKVDEASETIRSQRADFA